MPAAGQANVEDICKSYYYAGEVCLMNAQPDQAREWFKRCVATDLVFDSDTWPPVPMNEYHLALWRLKTLSLDSPTSFQAEPE